MARPPDVWLGHLVHLDRGHDAGLHLALFQRILQGERIDHRSQHPHLVSGNAVHHARLFGHAAEEIASAHDNGDFHAEIPDRQNLLRNLMELGDVHTKAAVGRQRFSRQFEQDSLVHSSKVSHISGGAAIPRMEQEFTI
jgi:hypothetical protein